MRRAHAKGQGQRSLGSKVRVETDVRTDGGDWITSRANANTIGKVDEQRHFVPTEHVGV